MNKKRNYIYILSIILIVVLMLSISSYLIINKSKNEEETLVKKEIPTIKEEYISTSLDKLNEYDNNIYIDSSSKEIRLNSSEKEINYLILGKYGNIYKNPITIEKDNNDSIETYGNYKILYDEDSEKYYYINSISKTISNMYESITPIYFKNNIIHYLLLNNDKQNYLLNINTDDLIELDSEIETIELYNETNEIGNDKYLIYKNNNDLYGLIDFNGNIIINAEYQELLPYNTSNTFIAKKNKLYGIINNKNEIQMDIKYNSVSYIDNYLILELNNKLGIYYNNKLIVNYKINYNNEDMYEYNIKDNCLYLNIISINDNNKLYKINNKGIERQLDGEYLNILDYNNELKYFYKINNNTRLEISIIDLDLYEYYSFDTYNKKEYDILLNFNNIENTNYYILDITYNKDDDLEENTIFIDLYNSKEITKKDALYNYFDNGYGFILYNNELTIYKNNEVLNTYKDITEYLGGYYFLTETYNKKEELTSIIYKLNFIKETKDK